MFLLDTYTLVAVLETSELIYCLRFMNACYYNMVISKFYVIWRETVCRVLCFSVS